MLLFGGDAGRGWRPWRTRLAAAVLALGGCVVPSDLLEDKACPCVEGYHCVADRCVRGDGTDAGRADLGAPDAGPDASTPDAFIPDASAADLGPDDLGQDQGAPDAGPPGPVAYYSCDALDGVFVRDGSGHGRDARCDGAGCPDIVPGRVGMACDFTTDARRLRVSYDPALIPSDPARTSNALSIALWIYLPSVSPPEHMSLIGVPFGSASVNIWQLYVIENSSDGSLRARWITTAEDTGNTNLAGPSLPAREWKHLVATYDGVEQTFHLDGSFFARRDADAPLVFDARDMTIGADENSGGTLALPLSGMLDEILIYDRVLSPAEIFALANPS